MPSPLPVPHRLRQIVAFPPPWAVPCGPLPCAWPGTPSLGFKRGHWERGAFLSSLLRSRGPSVPSMGVLFPTEDMVIPAKGAKTLSRPGPGLCRARAPSEPIFTAEGPHASNAQGCAGRGVTRVTRCDPRRGHASWCAPAGMSVRNPGLCHARLGSGCPASGPVSGGTSTPPWLGGHVSPAWPVRAQTTQPHDWCRQGQGSSVARESRAKT